jgi:Na+/melibiose symporter-like transporter
MPGITGLLLAVFIGRFLQTRRKIVPWFSASRLLVISAYAASGLAVFIVPENYLVQTILAIWAVATIPQIALNVCFSVVMNEVAGPDHRYDLMSRRWSILGLTTAVTVALVGQVLDQINFPINYQLVFMCLSVGGLISYYFSSRIDLPETLLPPSPPGRSFIQKSQDYLSLIRNNNDFVRFIIKRFFFQTGTLLAIPLFPLYFVREVQATDAWIGIINTAQTAVLLIGYLLWSRQSRVRGSRFVLLATTLGMSVYPALVALTHRVELIVLFAGLSGIFQAGIDLVFFDELMKTVPAEYSATFVSFAQSMYYAAAVFAPIIGTALATQIGLSGALLVSAGIRLVSFISFAYRNPRYSSASTS